MTKDEIFSLKILMEILEEDSYRISLNDEEEEEEGDFEDNPWKPENVYLKKIYLV
jgi:hypothetical protein